MRRRAIPMGLAVALLWLLPAPAPAQDGTEELPRLLADAETHLRSKSYGAGVQACTAALKLDPTSFVAHYTMGQCFQGLDNNTAAADAFAKALGQKPEHVELNHRYGCLLLTLGRPKDAQKPLEVAFAAQPELPGLRAALGRLYFEGGDLEKARGFLRNALRDNPKDAALRYYYGECLFRGEQYEDAAAEFKQAGEIARGRPEHNEIVPKIEQRFRQSEARTPNFGSVEQNGALFRNKAFRVTAEKPAGHAWAWLYPKPPIERLILQVGNEDDSVLATLDSYGHGVNYTIAGMLVKPAEMKVLCEALEKQFNLDHRDAKKVRPLPVLRNFKKQQTFAFTAVRKADVKKVDVQVTIAVTGTDTYKLEIQGDAGTLEKAPKELVKILGSIKFLEK